MTGVEDFAQGPMTGLKVLDLSRFIAGPYCSMILGDMGADVVKVEKPGLGDPARGYQPKIGDASAYSLVFNRNKRSVALEPRDADDLEILAGLVAKADVLVENFRPGTLEKMGLGPDRLKEINPRLIVARISGFGQDGPWAHLPAFDGIAQALGGLMDLTGDPDGPPTVCGTFVCDYAAGMYATMGILAALRVRDRTGQGQVVDISLLDTAASLLVSAIPEFHALGTRSRRTGNRDRYSAPTNVYRTMDGDWVYIVCGGAEYFPRLLRAMERPELIENPKFATVKDRRDNWDESEALVRSWSEAHTTEHVVGALQSAQVPCGKVATISEVATNPQLRHRGQIAEIEDPRVGTFHVQGVTIQMSGTPLSIRGATPAVGEHNDVVLGEWLGQEETA